MTSPQRQPPQDLLEGRNGHARVALLTVIPEELEAVKSVFGTTAQVRHKDGYTTQYWCRPDEVATRDFTVVVARCAARTNSQAMQAARDLLEHFRPPVLLLVGVAGGLHRRDGVELGDVVAADYVDYMEFVKIDERGVHLRHLPLDQPSVDLRMEVVEPLCQDQDPTWFADIGLDHPLGPGRRTRARVGMIVAGEKILSGPHNRIQKGLLEPFDKAIAVDMESKGVAEALCGYRRSVWYNPRYLVIRGISDMVEEVETTQSKRQVESPAPATEAAPIIGETETNAEQRERCKQYAAHAAAVFAKRIVADLLPRIYTYS